MPGHESGARRDSDLLIGHIVFAPVAAMWLTTLAGLPFVVAPGGTSFVGAFLGYGVVNLLLFFPIAVLLALAVALAFWRGREAARPMAASLAAICLAVQIGASSLEPGLERIGSTLLFFVRASFWVGLAWFPYVLFRTWRSLPAWLQAAYVLVVAFVSVMAYWPVYYRQDWILEGPDAMAFGDRGYLCTTVANHAQNASLGGMTAYRLGRSTPGGGPGRSRYDLVVVEIGPTSLETHRFEGSALADGFCFVHEGALHRIAEGRGASRQLAWRWDGRAFTELGAAESAAIVAAIEGGKTVLIQAQREGGQWANLSPRDPVELSVGSAKVTLRLEYDRSPERIYEMVERIHIARDGGKEALLLEADRRIRRISRDEYLALPEEGPSSSRPKEGWW